MKKFIITESQLKFIAEMFSDKETPYSIIGKTVGEIFNSPGVNMIDDKVIAYAKFFDGKGESFEAIGNAGTYLNSEGYDKGSMFMDYPIAFVKKGKLPMDDDGTTIITTKHGEERPLVITKFDRLSPSNWNEMDGAILPDPENPDFRDGNVFLVFFEFPE